VAPVHCWPVAYFDFVFLVLYFLRVVPFSDLESSSRTAADSFTVSILRLSSTLLTCPSFCTRFNERVYITAIGCEICFGTTGLQAACPRGLQPLGSKSNFTAHGCDIKTLSRPHWGKLFAMSPEQLKSRYNRLPDFIQLSKKYDPHGKFRNAFLERNIFSS
jgi:hypothetical protein